MDTKLTFTAIAVKQGDAFLLRSQNRAVTGPSLHFIGGQIKADGKVVCALPVGAWAHVEMTCPLGAAANGKWSLKVNVPGQAPVSLTDVPCDPRFGKLQWLGIVADANAAVTFYVDNVKLEVAQRSDR